MDQDRLTPDECFKLTGVHHPKVPVVRRPEYNIALEQFGEHTFAHAHFSVPWSQTVKASFKRDLDALLLLHGGPLLVLCQRGNVRLRKFATQAGFIYAMSVLTPDLGECDILIRRVPSPPESSKHNGRPLRRREDLPDR